MAFFLKNLRRSVPAVNVSTCLGSTCSIRNISSSEIATALRPFYFVVHPDLFGRYPEQRSVNEESLKHLSVQLEALQQRRMAHTSPAMLQFYVRDSDTDKKGSFKLVKITLERCNDTKIAIKRILESCNLSTDFVDAIKSTNSMTSSKLDDRFYGVDLREANPFSDINFKSGFSEFERNFRKKYEEKEKTLRSWIKNNIGIARDRSQDLEKLQEEVFKLEKSLVVKLELAEVRYDCGWNFEHYRGCLKTLERLADLHPNSMSNLKDRIVVFGAFTGVSLEGHLMLYTGDVLSSWRDFIRNIPKHDSFLKIIPAYEVALSQVLRNIKISRRKFMPKAQAYQYAGHLRKVTTTLLDFQGNQKYPDSWPDDLSDYEIVVESESGPLMVSPTGQFITPSTCPGSILVDFLTNNLDDAKSKAEQYEKNKHVERKLHKMCVEKLKLKSLNKDDSVTPERMIQCLERLLSVQLVDLAGLHLNIAKFYSIAADGTVCVPWDWKFE